MDIWQTKNNLKHSHNPDFSKCRDEDNCKLSSLGFFARFTVGILPISPEIFLAERMSPFDALKALTSNQVPDLWDPSTWNTSLQIMVPLFVLAVILLVIWLLMSEKRKLDAEKKQESGVMQICRKKGLNEKETNQILEAIKEVKLKQYTRGLESIGVFNRLVSPVLSQQVGPLQHDILRAKLFHNADNEPGEPHIIKRRTTRVLKNDNGMHGIVSESKTDRIEKEKAEKSTALKSPGSFRPLPGENTDSSDLLSAVRSAVLEVERDKPKDAGTRSIVSGQDIRIQFEHFPEMLHCGVMDSSKEGLTIFLPLNDGKTYRPTIGETLEAYLSKDGGYFYFESIVEEVFRGQVVSCRIRHSDDLHQIQRREFARAKLDYPFKFYHLPSNQFKPDSSEPEKERKLEKILRQGQLIDISAGGCAIVVSAPKGVKINDGDVLGFPIQMPDKRSPVKVVGKVLSHHPDGNIRNSEMIHVQFLGIDENLRSRLVRSIFDILQKQKKKTAKIKKQTGN